MEEAKKIIQWDDAGPKTGKAKKIRRLFTLLFILVLAAGIFGWFWSAGNRETVTVKDYVTAQVKKGAFVSTTEASGTVVLPAQVEILSPREGYTLRLLAEEGDEIVPEDILAELEVPDLEDSFNEVTVDLEQARIERESLENSSYYEIGQLERTLLRLDRDIREAREDAQAMEELAALKSSRRSDYEDALDVLEELEDQREDAQADLEGAEVSREIALRKQQAAIDQLQVDLDIVKKDIEENRIQSPIAGEVLSINEDLFIRGSLIGEAESLFVVADRDEVYIDFDVYEQYGSLLDTGDEMTVTIGTTTMKAEIIKIGRIATMDSDGLSAMISVRARPITDQTLTPGASAVATINLSVREDVLLLSRGAWLTTGNQKYLYVVQGDKAYKTEVVLGDIQGTDVEILEGVGQGDLVITGSYQSFIDQDVIGLK